MDNPIWCDSCKKWHRDSDPVEVVKSPRVIAVKCMRHTVWASREAIARLLGGGK